jgi:hypothetical protein
VRIISPGSGSCRAGWSEALLRTLARPNIGLAHATREKRDLNQAVSSSHAEQTRM